MDKNIYGQNPIRSQQDAVPIATAIMASRHFEDTIGDEKIVVLSDEEKFTIMRKSPDGSSTATYYDAKMMQRVLEQYIFLNRKTINAKIKEKQ